MNRQDNFEKQLGREIAYIYELSASGKSAVDKAVKIETCENDHKASPAKPLEQEELI